MKYSGSIICFVMSLVGGYMGATSDEFYPGKLGGKSTGKRVPTWFGRLWFFGFAVAMLYMGIQQLPR